MDGLFEYKNLSGGVKDIDTEKRIVTGYLASFGNEDSYGDIVEKGAFAKTLMERKNDIFFLNQHNWSQPHGKFSVLQEDMKGLYFESKPLIDTSYSSDLLKLYEAGIVKEHSFGYNTIVSEFDTTTNIRILKEIKLYEGSNVTRGANKKTPFLGMKSLTLKEINDQAKLITKAFRNGTFTDETFMLLEIALKQLQADAYELGKQSLEVKEPFNDTLIDDEPNKSIEIINKFRKSLWTN